MRPYPTPAGRKAFFNSVEERAAIILARKLSAILGATVDPYSMHLESVRGGASHAKADRQRWTGHFPRPDMPHLNYRIDSWDTALSRIANGCRFRLHDRRDFPKVPRAFEVTAPGEKP